MSKPTRREVYVFGRMLVAGLQSLDDRGYVRRKDGHLWGRVTGKRYSSWDVLDMYVGRRWRYIAPVERYDD